jgi:hypothetical protein
LFQAGFRFTTKLVELTSHKKPQHQLNSHLSQFIIEHDGPNNLLIVYYSGGAYFDMKDKILELSPDGSAASRIMASWNSADRLLCDEDDDADTLVIMDACYASDINDLAHASPHVAKVESSGRRKSLDSSTRIYELLAASAMGQPTAPPGLNSFSRALIDSLRRLLAEDPESSFTTTTLLDAINQHQGRIDASGVLWDRISNPEGRRIRLGQIRRDPKVVPDSTFAKLLGRVVLATKERISCRGDSRC